MRQLLRSLCAILAVGIPLLSSCSSSTTPGDSTTSGLTGTIVYSLPAKSDQIYLYQPASHAITTVVHGANPSWMPDGNIIYERDGFLNPSGHEEIRISNTSGTSVKTLIDMIDGINGSQVSAKVSPDGKYVAYNYYNSVGMTHQFNWVTYLHTTADGELFGYIDSLFDAAWCPDGGLVLSGTLTPWTGSRKITPYHEGLYRVTPDFKVSVIPNTYTMTEPQEPAVSPDGTKIAFVMNQHIWVIGMDGSGLKQITEGDKEEFYPAWSPDGKNIACESLGTFEILSYGALAVVPSDPSTPTTLANTSSAWMRDSKGERIQVEGNMSWK